MSLPAPAFPRPSRFFETGGTQESRDDQGEALDLAMETSHLVWWDWRIEENRITIHPAGPCILGQDGMPLPTDADGWLDRVHPDDLVRVRESLEACVSGGQARWDCEHRFRACGGQWLWVANHGRVMKFDEVTKRAVRLIGTTQDIETRKRADEARARDSALLTHIQDAIYCLDTDLNYTYWNAGAESLYGWSATDLLGRHFTLRIPPAQASAHVALLRRVLAGETFSAEIECPARGDSVVWADVQAYRLQDDQGRVVGVMTVARDITQRRREQAERLHMERQLAQSQKMETLGTLAGGIAHDFNNLLAAILGYAEIAGALLPEGHPALTKLDKVTSAGKRAAELVRRITAFSRAGEQTRAPVNLNHLVQETLSLLRASLPTTIALEPGLAPGEALTLGDATQLQQILLNCCANSAHALQGRSDGHLFVGVESLQLTEPAPAQSGSLHPGPYVRLRVRDDGSGMPPEVLTHIFEPFFTTRAAGEGTGLGLAFAQGIVAAHGGAICVESRPGAGTCLDIYLPALRQNSAATASSPTCADRAVRGAGEAIAVIDDEESISLLAQQALDFNGYRATAFSRAHDCLERLLDRPDAFRLVITDQTMPRMTGMDLLKALRAAGNPVPVLILSGYARGIEPTELIGLGRVGFLGKPFDLSALCREVERLLHPPI
jgi:PAS domain S-box-containing protein